MLRTPTFNDVLFILQATRWTIVLSVLAIAGGALLGAVVAVWRIAPFIALRALARAYVQLVQATPLLMLIFLFYFGVGIVGLDVPPLIAAAGALVLYSGAFLGEIWQGCLRAVPRAQWEGALALGLSWGRTLRLVVLPQAVRMSLPPTVGFLVQVIKGTSLASIVGFMDVMRAAQIVNNATFEPYLIFPLVGAIYFALCYPLSTLSRWLERRLNVRAEVGWSM